MSDPIANARAMVLRQQALQASNAKEAERVRTAIDGELARVDARLKTVGQGDEYLLLVQQRARLVSARGLLSS